MKMFKTFINMGNLSLVETMIEQQNLDCFKFGPEFLAYSTLYGKKDIVDLFIGKGADIMNPPDTLDGEEDYRRTPYIILAAQSGDQPTFEAILKHGGSLSDTGFICLSKKRKNMVISNVVGAAAYFGKTKLLSYLIKKVAKDYFDVEAIEQPDKHAK